MRPSHLIAFLSALLAVTWFSRPAAGQSDRPLDVVRQQTVPGLGAGQGIAVRGNRIYLYGDAETGVIREFRFRREPRPRLVATGREIELTRRGKNVVPHPTGLTFHPEHGAVLGNTVSGRGTLHFIDFERALADGNLDRALLHTVRDDAAKNGTRPEFVRKDGRWYVATSDYGGEGNELRLYDPRRLRRARRTSEPGVLASREPSGSFVQTLHWIDGARKLVFAQNRRGGEGYRLTFYDPRSRKPPRRARPYDVPGESRELEGFALLKGGYALLLNAHEKDNLQLARVRGPLARARDRGEGRSRSRRVKERLRGSERARRARSPARRGRAAPVRRAPRARRRGARARGRAR